VGVLRGGGMRVAKAVLIPFFTPEEWAGCEIMRDYQSARFICMKSLMIAVFFFLAFSGTHRGWVDAAAGL